MVPRVCLLLFAAAPSRVAHAADDAMDLYVRERFQDANGEPCAGACEGDGCYLRAQSFFLRKSCFNRGDAKSSLYEELEEGLVCRQDSRASCENNPLVFDAATADDCRQSWTVDVCTGSEHLKKLSGWCTASTVALGEYTVPLLSFREFDDVEACGSADYNELLLPDDGGRCMALSYFFDGTLVDGSRQGSCDGNVFNGVRYATPDCTGEAQPTNLDGISDQCPDEAPGTFLYTEDCGAPKIHCKPSPLLGKAAGSQANREVAVGTQGGDAAGASDEESPKSNTGLIVGLALGGAALLGAVGAGLAVRKKRRANQETARGGFDEVKDEYQGSVSEEGSATLQNDYTDQESIPPPPEMELGEEGEVDVVDGGDYADEEGSEPPAPPEEAPPAKEGRKWGRFGRK